MISVLRRLLLIAPQFLRRFRLFPLERGSFGDRLGLLVGEDAVVLGTLDTRRLAIERGEFSILPRAPSFRLNSIGLRFLLRLAA